MGAEVKYYYFIGIGGIGMSAIARYFLQQGFQVHGYDKTPSNVTDKLIKEGAIIGFEDNPNLLPQELKNSVNVEVVYTPAIPKDNRIFQYFSEEYSIKKRAEVLGEITKQTRNLSIAGTHGKTTTSCLLAAIFKHSDKQFSAFLGGISADLGSNYFHQPGESEHFSITEADEYDRSFLHLSPNAAVITSTDADHLDIYEEHNAMLGTYQEFGDLVQAENALFVAKNKADISNGVSYSASDSSAHFFAEVIEVAPDASTFNILKNGEKVIENVVLNIPGFHNIENALGASLLASHAGISSSIIKEGLSSFKGIKRRFERIIQTRGFSYIDDYAHHPSEIKSIIDSVKAVYPGKRITAVFQPHLFTRTRDFLKGFASELSKIDTLILLPIYPARELPIAGITSERILELVTIEHKHLLQKDELVNFLKRHSTDVLLTLGAGDIDRLVQPIKDMYENN